jgi:hypothetical protein
MKKCLLKKINHHPRQTPLTKNLQFNPHAHRKREEKRREEKKSQSRKFGNVMPVRFQLHSRTRRLHFPCQFPHHHSFNLARICVCLLKGTTVPRLLRRARVLV